MEVVISISEEHAVVFTIKFQCVAQIADPFHDLLKKLIDVEQIGQLWVGELVVVRNLLPGILDVLT